MSLYIELRCLAREPTIEFPIHKRISAAQSMRSSCWTASRSLSYRSARVPSPGSSHFGVSKASGCGDPLLFALSTFVDHSLLEMLSVWCISWAVLLTSLTILVFFFGFPLAHSWNYHFYFFFSGFCSRASLFVYMLSLGHVHSFNLYLCAYAIPSQDLSLCLQPVLLFLLALK